MITQHWNDDRILMNGKYIGCATKENADTIMMMQEVIIQLAEAPEHACSFVLQMQAKSILEDLK